MIYIYPQAEPFFLSGTTDIALLFIHGFTASPSELLPAARLLHEKTGHTISAPLLPGHGSHPRDLNRTTWEDWYQAVQVEISYLKENYEKVFVLGLSMGGLLALHSARQYDINGVIVINAPIQNNFPLLTASAPVMRYVKPYVPKKARLQMQDLENQGRFAYGVTPVRAFQSMMKLRQQVINELEDIKVPLLIMQSLKDESVNPKSGRLIYEKCSDVARLLELANSSHIATMGPEIEEIAEEIRNFIQEECKLID